MNLSQLGVDVYQLTTLAAHDRLGRLKHDITMGFFFRKLPPARNYVVFAGIRRIADWCRVLRFDDEDLAVMDRNASLGPLLRKQPAAREALRRLDGFRGEIDALPEGTLAFAGPGQTTAGEPLVIGDAPLQLYTPLLMVHTSMVHAKLIETPWLSYINYMSMVASKASRVVTAAGGRPVLEFGQRRTHHQAAVDGAYAAYLAGVTGTSNLAAEARYGIPASGTMDHFAVQASERDDTPPGETEREFFEAFVELMPERNVLLVDTYDTDRGLELAARAGGGGLFAVRLDSNVTPDSVRRARSILDAHGAAATRIFVSDSLDEWRVRDLAAAGADAFGVGENITCSPDSAKGIGAVGKITVNGYDRSTMKFSRGSGKATLPGRLQAWRSSDHDLIALHHEAGPSGARRLLEPFWRDAAPVTELPELSDSRRHVLEQVEALPDHLRDLPTDHGRPWPLVASDALVDLIRVRAREAGL